MDRLELRKVLRKRPKTDLIKLVTNFKNNCPSIQINFDVNKLSQESLALKLWSIILNLRNEHPDEGELCVDMLKEEHLRKDEEIEDQEDKNIPNIIKEIPFDPQFVCKKFLEMLNTDKNFMEKWENSRKYSGFISLIGINDLALNPELIEYLFNKIFEEREEKVDDKMLVKFARSQIEDWEIELKKTLSILNSNEIDLILSINLIIQGLVNLLEITNQKIVYNYDDIPILKRVILAQYLKLLDKDSCDDSNLDDLAVILNRVIEQISSSIKILPWSDFE